MNEKTQKIKWLVGTSTYNPHYLSPLPSDDTEFSDGIPSDSVEFPSEEKAWQFVESLRD